MDLCKDGSGSQDSPIVVYKLIRQLKNGALRSLFIDAKCDRPIGEWLEAEFHPTKGFEPRFGWHCTFLPIAPHLTTKGRVWVEVILDGEVEFKDRPACQGGRWLLGKGRMMITRILSDDEVRRLQESASDSPQAG